MAQLTKAMHDVRNAVDPQGQGRGAAAGDPAAVRARRDQDLRDAEGRRQAGLALLRRRGPQPLPARRGTTAGPASPRTRSRCSTPPRRSCAAPGSRRPSRSGTPRSTTACRAAARAVPRQPRSRPPSRPPTWSGPTSCRPRTTSSGSPGTATTGAGSPVVARSATRCSPTPTTPRRVTAAGRAYVRVQKWMHGTMQGKPGQRPCAKDSRGTYTCVVTDSSGTRRIYWNPFRQATVRLAEHRPPQAGRARRGHQRQGRLDPDRQLPPGDGLPLTRRVTPRSGARRSWSRGRRSSGRARAPRSSPARRPGRGVRA